MWPALIDVVVIRHDGTKAKLSEASYKILSAAGTDLTALILGAGEAVLQRIRR